MKLAVNEFFPLALPNEGLFLEWRGSSSPFLIMNIANPSKSEIKGLKDRSEFALAYMDGIIFLLARAGNDALPWCDAPFSIQLYKEDERPVIPKEISEEARLSLTFVLVNAADTRVKMLKQCTFSPKFTQELFRLITLQRNSTTKNWNHDSVLQDVYSRYEPTQLASKALVKCFAGA